MPSENNRLMQKALATALKHHGFRKHGATWRKQYGDAIGVLNVQGSQWSPSFYITLGVYYCALGDSEKPLEYHCHIRTRLLELVPDRARLTDLLDLERPIPMTRRFAELEAAVIAHGVPWLERVSSLEGAREYCSDLPARSPWVTAEARKLLGLEVGV